jgi:hypothetical protein
MPWNSPFWVFGLEQRYLNVGNFQTPSTKIPYFVLVGSRLGTGAGKELYLVADPQ